MTVKTCTNPGKPGKLDDHAGPFILMSPQGSQVCKTCFSLILSDRAAVITRTGGKPDSIDEIEAIRSKNNSVWMEILRVALETAPERTKKLIHTINENDKAVTALLEHVAKS